MPRNGSYLYKRKGSQNWYLRIQFPAWMKPEARSVYFNGDDIQPSGIPTKYEKSLNTTDRDEAEILASPIIATHKQSLFLRKQLLKIDCAIELGPRRFAANGMHRCDNGEIAHVDGNVVKYYDQDYNFLRDGTNSHTVMPKWQWGARDFREIETIKSYMPKQVSADDALVHEWIKRRNIQKHMANEALSVWNDFNSVVNSKPLSKCTRDDARKLADLLLSRNNTSHTVAKKIGHLRTIANFGIADGKLSSNPFLKAFKPGNDKIDRAPLSEEDMALAKTNLHLLTKQDRLLWCILATTGMRLSEPFQITEETITSGVRHIVVGTKTKSSKRRIPLPSCLLDDLPPRILGPLFHGNSADAGKRLRYFMKKLGIAYDTKRRTGDKRKVLHSLRHRAKDRLRESGCPLDIQYEIMGHEHVTVAASYGRGYPITHLRDYIDTIGY